MDNKEQVKEKLNESDLDLIRVLDDVIDLLIKNQVISFTDLPVAAQEKLGQRRKMRSDMVSLKSLIGDENNEGIF